MREIKFRAWDNVELKIRRVVKIDYPEWIVCVMDDYNNFQCERNSFSNSEQDRFLLMQYTGLKDKNGVEIYELMGIDNLYEVSFLNGSYVLTNISNGDIILLYDYMKEKNGEVEITCEYTKIQRDTKGSFNKYVP